MNTRLNLARVLVLMGSTLALCASSWCVTSAVTLWRPHTQADLISQGVYAYHPWQSMGKYLNLGDQVTLTAMGQWTYSPQAVGLHGPEGGLPAPAYYPLPAAPGGALLGRVGETGPVFYVGRRLSFVATAPGLLYLGINDDLLGDNVGELTVKVEVVTATPTP